MAKDIADLVRKVGAASKSLTPKPIKLLKPMGKELTAPIGSLKPRAMSMGAEDAFGVNPFNRRSKVPGVLGGKTNVGGFGSRAFAGRGRVKSFR